MKYLVIGSGGREHAIAWRLKKDEPEAELFVAPGNAGTAQIGTNVPIAVTDLDALVNWAKQEQPDLTVVGPEGPLCAGIVDHFEAAGLPIFGPNQAAARLEGSKVYTKNILLEHSLPTAPGRCFSSSEEALAYSRAHPHFPQVIKADGLAAGKGVIIAKNAREAEEAIRQIMEARVFGEAGNEIVIEDFLPGREMSVHVVTDGTDYKLLPIAQDHKKLLDGDKGPNTGGMGAYAPAPFATPELIARLEQEIVQPVLAALKAESIDFRGILYIGIIWTEAGPQILEFNVRGGDPETQVLLPLLETPLIELLKATSARQLRSLTVRFRETYAVTIVMAAHGYPEKPRVGDVITKIPEELANAIVFHGGTKQVGNNCVSSGGRILTPTAWGEELPTIRQEAYKIAEKIVLADVHYRCDIADNVSLR